MSSDPRLHIDVRESADRVVTVTLRGVLSLASTPDVRRVLSKHLADGPTAAIVDIRRLGVGPAAAATVFRAVARQQPAPGVPVILVTGRRSAHLPVGVARSAPLIVCLTLAEANDLAHRRLAADRRLLQLAPVPAAATEARQLVQDACRDWGVAHVAEVAAVVVSELVTNAVTHAGTAIEVSVSNRGAHLYLAVCDGSPVMPQQRAAGRRDDPGPGGWGLYLVDVFAVAWGVVPLPAGKRVWASIRTRPRVPREAP